MDRVFNNNVNFRANLLLTGKKELLKKNQIQKLSQQVQSIGKKDDIVNVNIVSDIIDWAEVNKNNQPKKFLSGYKMYVETTIDGFEKQDLSAADTQQRFWEGHFQPFNVLSDWISSVKNGEKFDNKKINISPEIYNSGNKNWDSWASIETPDIVPNTITKGKGFFNSPAYKAITGKKDTSLSAVFNDNLANNSHRIDIETLKQNISDLKRGKNIKAPVMDFSKGIVHPEAEDIDSTKYIFIDGLQTQFPQIEELADLIIRMKVPENVREKRFINRSMQFGTSPEQSTKDLKASNEYMEKLIPFNPDSADVEINGRYDKDNLFELLRILFKKNDLPAN